jgi:amidase
VIRKCVVVATCLLLAACSNPSQDFSESTIAELHDSMQRGELTSEQLIAWYIQRIDDVDRAGPTLNAIIELNPDALMTARALDEEWQRSGPRGPMHGIPVVLKANIDTADKMHTTAGSLALAQHIPRKDAFIVSRLRDAGAVILGKANLSEWANFRSDRSSSGWSSIGGQTRNPYDTTRNPCGSSSGSAVSVSANLTVVAIGTETDGSVVCPSGINGVVGIKPSLGLISFSGIIPIAHSQDTAGPMARTVRDAAILLGAMTGTDVDDSLSAVFENTPADFTSKLAADALRGKRVGVIRSFYGSGSNPEVEAILASSIDALKAQGAEVLDNIMLEIDGMRAAEGVVLDYEFKADLALYFKKSNAPFQTLAEIIEFNAANADTVMPIFGQDRMHGADESGELTDQAYLDALQASKRISQSAIDSVLQEHDLDVLIAPTNGPAWKTDHVNGDTFHIGSSSYAAVSGYPSVTVPAGFATGLPIGMSFIGTMKSDKALIEIAYAFEQATRVRQAPDL